MGFTPAKSALYIDFDNFFGGLLAADPKAALEVVQNPSIWVERLRAEHSETGRRWLVLRCYMNPSGWVAHPHSAGERLYFSKFRPFFTQAGFEIIDCPSLTRSTKNGADIRMVVDIMTALRAQTRLDEIVIASSDSDFTHLLHVVRADDRRIVMIATSVTAVAYQALADIYLDEQDVLDLMREPEETPAADSSGAATTATEPSPGEPSTEQVGEPGPGDAPTEVVDWQTFADLVRSTYEAAAEPINLARWSTNLIQRFGQGLSSGRWFDTGGFTRALESVHLEGLRLSQHFAWDTRRHSAPEDLVSSAPDGLPPQIATFAQIAQLPRMPRDRWPVVFQALEAYALTHEFRLTEATRWARDHAAQQGVDVPRSAFAYVVRSCLLGGAPLNADPSPTSHQIGEALLTSVLEGAARAGLEVSDDDTAALRSWLHVDPSNEPGPT